MVRLPPVAEVPLEKKKKKELHLLFFLAHGVQRANVCVGSGDEMSLPRNCFMRPVGVGLSGYGTSGTWTMPKSLYLRALSRGVSFQFWCKRTGHPCHGPQEDSAANQRTEQTL